MPRISQLSDLDTPAANDILLLVDQSTGQTKKILLSDLLGIPNLGWTSAAESWSYASWSSGTRIGVLTVPSDATTKYSAGMRIKITQSTGGTKYGIIVEVTSTTITIFFQSGTTLNNETISDNFYSTLKAPLGFNPDPLQWQISLSDTNDNTRNSPTAGTWYNQGSISQAIGKGAWKLRLKASLNVVVSGTSSGGEVCLSTANNSASDDRLTFHINNSSGITQHGLTNTVEAYVLLSSQTTYYVNIRATSGSNTSVAILGSSRYPTRITATCAYL